MAIDPNYLRAAVAYDPENGMHHAAITDFSDATLQGLDGPRVNAFKKWRATGYHPDVMPVGYHGLTKGDLYDARALYTHLDPNAVQMHVDNPTGFDPLKVNGV